VGDRKEVKHLEEKKKSARGNPRDGRGKGSGNSHPNLRVTESGRRGGNQPDLSQHKNEERNDLGENNPQERIRNETRRGRQDSSRVATKKKVEITPNSYGVI